SPKPARVPSPPQAAQDSVSYRADTGAKRASLVRRLAEAADGYRDGKLKWVGVDRSFPHSVALVLEDTTRGQDSLRRLIRAKEVPTTCEYAPCDYRLYGPFLTPKDSGYVEDKDQEIDSIIVVTVKGKRKYYDP